MKKILITGAGSFIGTSFEKYIQNHSKAAEYEISVMDTLTGKIVPNSEHGIIQEAASASTADSKPESNDEAGKSDETWNFTGYDVVFHVAGIAHADVGKVSEEGKELYKKVNTDLAIDVAKKAKAAGVKQFIFMSSAIVYGASSPVGKEKVITKDTKPEPENFYGESKLNAEKGLEELTHDDAKEATQDAAKPLIHDDAKEAIHDVAKPLIHDDAKEAIHDVAKPLTHDASKEATLEDAKAETQDAAKPEVGNANGKDDLSFKVVILRPPMIYGPGCRGNYNSLRKFALKLPIFPKVKNERSMLYIDNLCEFIRLMIDKEESGLFHPANAELSNTSEMVRLIAKAHDKNIALIGGTSWLLKIMSHFTGLVNKAFGNLTYSNELTEYKENYRVCSLEDSILSTEKSKK